MNFKAWNDSLAVENSGKTKFESGNKFSKSQGISVVEKRRRGTERKEMKINIFPVPPQILEDADNSEKTVKPRERDIDVEEHAR